MNKKTPASTLIDALLRASGAKTGRMGNTPMSATPPEVPNSDLNGGDPVLQELPWSKGDIRKAMGFDPDDESIEVHVIGGGFGRSLTPADLRPEQVTAAVTPSMTDRAMKVMEEVVLELKHAQATHAPMHSPHEGYAVIKEELEELWDEIKADNGRGTPAREEAVQIAAMAIRYLLDIEPGT